MEGGRYSEMGWAWAPTLNKLGLKYHHRWKYARKWLSPVYEISSLECYTYIYYLRLYNVHKVTSNIILFRPMVIQILLYGKGTPSYTNGIFLSFVKRLREFFSQAKEK